MGRMSPPLFASYPKRSKFAQQEGKEPSRKVKRDARERVRFGHIGSELVASFLRSCEHCCCFCWCPWPPRLGPGLFSLNTGEAAVCGDQPVSCLDLCFLRNGAVAKGA